MENLSMCILTYQVTSFSVSRMKLPTKCLDNYNLIIKGAHYRGNNICTQ